MSSFGRRGLTVGPAPAAAEILARLSFLRDVGRRDLERVARRLQTLRFPKSALLFREGDPCPGFWIVRAGSVRVFKVSERGRIRILDTFGPGEAFALVSALDGGPYPASAEAREDATLFFVPCGALRELLQAAPEAATAVARDLAERLRRHTRNVAAATLYDVRSRTAAFILAEARARGVRRPDGSIDFVLPGTQKEIARRIGTAREVYARTLKTLAQEGVIAHRRRLVKVIAPAALARAAGEEDEFTTRAANARAR